MRRCDLCARRGRRRPRAGAAPRARIGVVPNGVDTAAFDQAALSPRARGAGLRPVRWCSAARSTTGRTSMRWCGSPARCCRCCARAPRSARAGGGRRPAPALQQLAQHRHIVLTGEVADARPFTAGAAVYIVPMRIGGGVRLKLLEGLAGRAGGEHAHGRRRRGGPARWRALPAGRSARRVRGGGAAPARQLGLGARLGAAGRALVRQHYDWNAIVPQMEAHYIRA